MNFNEWLKLKRQSTASQKDAANTDTVTNASGNTVAKNLENGKKPVPSSVFKVMQKIKQSKRKDKLSHGDGWWYVSVKEYFKNL